MSSTPLLAQRRQADQALAARDPRISALGSVLDDDRLSALLGEAVRITRVRYKPGTSVLVAFCQAGPGGYGWASTRAAGVGAKLQHRAQRSERYGGGIRLFQPEPRHEESIVAVGGIEDDWPLRENLLWLFEHGLGRLGAGREAPGSLLGPTGRVLRYKPERRIVLGVPAGQNAIVVKTATQPRPHAAGPGLAERLLQGGVPVLAELADAQCAEHGISASRQWGDGDLDGCADEHCAYLAGEALAALHAVDPGPAGAADDGAAKLVHQLRATRDMVTALLPELDKPATLAMHELAALVTMGAQSGRKVLVHGDFSPDQVLVDGAAVRIIDFDRIGTGAPELDIGFFAAAEEIADRGTGGGGPGGPKTDSLMAGYLRAGGHPFGYRANAWAALRFFISAVDPFRDRDPDWPATAHWQIRRTLELIT
ncbi:phosphotransferase family protein [Pseudarthrobacter sp. P1]|uniref:phosphotransferase family protein n=1 Tax=Pseudarthrobacter sp. P1 TaxID=3418418 RepID=UPI003CEC6663